jgi:hypothetical protein
MALRDPVAVYTAASNVELQLLRIALETAGIEAFAIEDVSQVGTWMLGLMPEIHKPQIWVDRADVDRARPVLDEYERQVAERRAGHRRDQPSKKSAVAVICEDCGVTSTFAAELSGSIQDCPHCGAYVDVGDDESLDSETDESP